MNWAAELLRSRLARNICYVSRIVRSIAISTPVTLKRASSYVDNRYTLVLITISEIGFVGFNVNGDFSNATIMRLTITVAILSAPPVSL